MKKKFFLLVLIILTVGIIGIIFMNSAMVREESSLQSRRVLSIVLRTMMPNADAAKTTLVHHHIRKAAHVIEYTCLGIILALVSRFFERKTKRKYICFPLFTGLSVGVIDEYIQSFNDRSSEVRDVIIDFGGIFLGVAIVMIFFLIKDLIKKS